MTLASLPVERLLGLLIIVLSVVAVVRAPYRQMTVARRVIFALMVLLSFAAAMLVHHR